MVSSVATEIPSGSLCFTPAFDTHDAYRGWIARAPHNPRIFASGHWVCRQFLEISSPDKIIERLGWRFFIKSVLSDEGVHHTQILSENALPGLLRSGHIPR